MKNLFLFDLSQFDEGGSVGAAEGAATSDDGLQAEKDATATLNDAEGSDDNSLAKSEETEKPSFEDLIKGEYKEDYNKKVNSVVKNRLKNAKETQAKLDGLYPVMEALASRYKLDVNAEPQAFIDAIYDDDMLYENESLERNIPVEDLKRMKKMERENETMRRQLEQEALERENAEHMQKLFAEAEELKGLYPDFDFDYESFDAPTKETFITLVNAGVPMKNAYETLHPEIFAQAMGVVANKAAEKVANSIKANKSMPVMAANGKAASSPAKLDPSQFSRREIDDLIERANRGERIVF